MNADLMTNARLEKGYDDIAAGKVQNTSEAFKNQIYIQN